MAGLFLRTFEYIASGQEGLLSGSARSSKSDFTTASCFFPHGFTKKKGVAKAKTVQESKPPAGFDVSPAREDGLDTSHIILSPLAFEQEAKEKLAVPTNKGQDGDSRRGGREAEMVAESEAASDFDKAKMHGPSKGQPAQMDTNWRATEGPRLPRSYSSSSNDSDTDTSDPKSNPDDSRTSSLHSVSLNLYKRSSFHWLASSGSKTLQINYPSSKEDHSEDSFSDRNLEAVQLMQAPGMGVRRVKVCSGERQQKGPCGAQMEDEEAQSRHEALLPEHYCFQESALGRHSHSPFLGLHAAEQQIGLPRRHSSLGDDGSCSTKDDVGLTVKKMPTSCSRDRVSLARPVTEPVGNESWIKRLRRRFVGWTKSECITATEMFPQMCNAELEYWIPMQWAIRMIHRAYVCGYIVEPRDLNTLIMVLSLEVHEPAWAPVGFLGHSEVNSSQ
ncbi:unnamed protein product [Protopolystoma xenopodis]|uniref:Uncharacterized protein n=1 Tax=Protopolystoma xenopodis TaxID=117903 RepID=A0A448WAT1_9PLAT|nr:unnamed protein product [Protopolystoma xenopodis]